MRVFVVLLALCAGSSVVAENARVRYSWTSLRSNEKELYLNAIAKAMTSGYHMLFTQLFMDSGSLNQVVGTCGAPAWYRKYLLGYENMLRSLDPTFSKLTLPYWDLFEDAAKRISTRVACNGIEECSSMLVDFGGCNGPEISSGAYIVNGEAIPSGNCANSSIAAHACTSRKKCEKCIPRGDWTIGDSSLEVGPTVFIDLIRQARNSTGVSESRATAINSLRTAIQNSIQMPLHSILGGLYETRAAAFDPIFLGHYATLDMVYQVYQSCNQSIPLTGSCQGNSDLKVSSMVTIPMQFGSSPVEEHPKLGPFFETIGTKYKSMDAFAVTYEIDLFLQNMLKSFSRQCSVDTSAAGALSYASAKSTVEHAASTDTLVSSLAACDQTSDVTGMTTEAASAFISCQILSSLQNGVFTNTSTPVREFFRANQSNLPKCVSDLAAITSAEVTVIPSSTCREALYSDTSISTKTDFNLRKNGFAIVTRGEQDGSIRFMNPPGK
ncbi:hypothetical protein CCR75_004163 [Bremia lactucae]|uniref:Tyrosinase copper-binding domain-containing protein n=1 Tax=Bremia lactucae TaxID=4779 RepID=A0A976IE71_BRELC|nr:hypothetical protein CCR75_004163 [Bremia lactucae]